MTDPALVLGLGGSTYVTPDGAVLTSLPAGSTLYPVPADLRLEPALVAAALREFADVGLAADDLAERWVAAGHESDPAKAMILTLEIASVVTAMALHVTAPGVALAFEVAATAVKGLFEHHGGLDARTAAVLQGIRSRIDGEADERRADALIDLRVPVQAGATNLRTLHGELVTHRPTGAARLAKFQQMRAVVDGLTQPVVRIQNEDWIEAYDRGQRWAALSMSNVLVRVRPDGSLEQAQPWPPGNTAFHHRFGVPTLLWAGTTYPSLIQLAVPWFRSDGSFRDRLRDLAAAIDRFVVRMQADCWSRTEHTESSVHRHTWDPFRLLRHSPFDDLLGVKAASIQGSLPVGAFDLPRYTDGYLQHRWHTAFTAGADTGAMGTFDYSWWPPQSVLLPQHHAEIVAAANAAARTEYARLMVVTGAVHLMLVSALLRHLSAPPTASETVTGTAAGGRTLVGESAITAAAPVIAFSGPITAPATLRRYRARARARFRTQLPGHDPALRYRVVLRTISSVVGRGGFTSDRYGGRIWAAELEPIPADPMNKRLRTTFEAGLVLGEVELHDGVSPAAPVRTPSRTATLTADTFDWYVPAADRWATGIEDLDRTLPDMTGSAGGQGGGAPAPGSRSIHLTDAARELRASAVAPPGLPVRDDPYGSWTRGALTDVGDALEPLADALGAFAELDLAAAERRHVRREQVAFEYELTWADGALEVRLAGRPENRAVQVWVVVEEAVQSGEPDNSVRWLHTAVAAELVNQTVVVPRSFFAAERAAHERAGTICDEMDRRFSEVAEVGPDDPVVRAGVRARDLVTGSACTATVVEAMALRLDAFRDHRPDIWNEVVG